LRLENIELDPNQPRKNLGDIADLVTSIQDHGIISPLVVRPLGPNRYCIVAGERRFTAAKQAGFDVVPCMVREPSEQETLEIQLIENLHRKDLDPFEEAEGYARLKSEHNFTDADIAKKMVKARSTITETLGLVRIPDELREQCRNSDIRLSRDTLYLIAKQKTPKAMLAVFQDAKDGIPHHQRRAKARKGEARTISASRKPKWAYTSSDAKATVVVQSHNSTLTRERRIQALTDALKEAKSE
jgi:ParB family chromosome partitioning protein